MYDALQNVFRFTLPNGITVFSHYMKNRPWVSMGFVFHCDAKEDPPHKSGVCHFLEHMMRQNAPKPKEEMEDFFEDIGGYGEYGKVSALYNQYGFFVNKDDQFLSEALFLFGKMLLHNPLTHDIENEREIIITEFFEKFPNKHMLKHTIESHKHSFPGLWCENIISPIGQPKSIKSIQKKELREFYEKHFTPHNLSIVCVGGIPPEKLEKTLLESPFSINREGKRTPVLLGMSEVPKPTKTRFIIYAKDFLPSNTEIGSYKSINLLPGTTKPSSIKVLIRMIEKTIDLEIREKRGWAYSYYVFDMSLQCFNVLYIVLSGLKKDSLEKIEETINILLHSLRNNKDLFIKAQRQEIAELQMIDDNGRGIKNKIVDQLCKFQRVIPLHEEKEELESVTMEDILHLLNHMTPDRRYVELILLKKPWKIWEWRPFFSRKTK